MKDPAGLPICNFERRNIDNGPDLGITFSKKPAFLEWNSDVFIGPTFRFHSAAPSPKFHFLRSNQTLRSVPK